MARKMKKMARGIPKSKVVATIAKARKVMELKPRASKSEFEMDDARMKPRKKR